VTILDKTSKTFHSIKVKASRDLELLLPIPNRYVKQISADDTGMQIPGKVGQLFDHTEPP
jgi:hypothetical protein